MCLIKSPKIPPPPAPPEIPAPPRRIDPDVLSARSRQRKRAAAAFGSSATVLTGGRGLAGVQANLAGGSLLAGRGQSQAATVRRGAAVAPTPTPGAAAGAAAGAATLGPSGDISGGLSAEERRRLAQAAIGGVSGFGLGGGGGGTVIGGGGGGTIIGGGGGGGGRDGRFQRLR